MENLAGKPDCDKKIERELTRCKIQIVRYQFRSGEVSSSLRGKLGSFNFRRAWSHWSVEGDVPLSIAKELYDDPVGNADIRVVGHCGCPPPGDPWIIWRDKKGRELKFTKYRKELEGLTRLAQGGIAKAAAEALNDPMTRFVESPSTEGEGFIPYYHIDSEIGLRLFADTLRKHGLV